MTDRRHLRSRTPLGVRRRFNAIVRSVTGFLHEIEDLKADLKPQRLEEVEDPKTALTYETHLLGLLHVFASHLEDACLLEHQNRHTWNEPYFKELECSVVYLIRQRVEARIEWILLAIAQGYGTSWRSDLEFEIWSALVEDHGQGGVDLLGHGAELQDLLRQSLHWWRWNPEEGQLEKVWLGDWEPLYEAWRVFGARRESPDLQRR